MKSAASRATVSESGASSAGHEGQVLCVSSHTLMPVTQLTCSLVHLIGSLATSKQMLQCKSSEGVVMNRPDFQPPLILFDAAMMQSGDVVMFLQAVGRRSWS
jgi:hypothetical protein